MSHGHAHPLEERRHGGARSALLARLRPHQHDTSEKTDVALEADERGLRALKVSFLALMGTAGLQLAVVVLTDSVALLADTVHNFSDALTAVPLFVAFRLGRRPPSRRYTYGYRRAEDLAGVFIVAVMALSAAVAAWEAVDRVLRPRPVDHVGLLFVAGLLGFAGNELVAAYRIRVGHSIGSAALVADGHHARADGFTSLGVALGAVAAWLGVERADGVVGLIISVAIVFVLRGAAAQIYGRLMDAVDPNLVSQVEDIAAGIAGVQALGPVRVRWLGHRLVAELTVVVDRDLTVAGGHAIAETVRHALLHRVPHLDGGGVHVDPCRHDGSNPHFDVSHHHDPGIGMGPPP